MASEVDICNLALAHLGDDAILSSINPPDGSPQSQHCATFYPVARNSMQDVHNWSFCTTRVTLALLSTTPLSGWQYTYALPSDMVSALSVFLAGSADDNDPQPYEIEQTQAGVDVLYTNAPNAILRYVRNVTDPSTFSPLFVDALAWLVASYVAGPLIKGAKGRADAVTCLKMYKAVLKDAIESDSAQHVAVKPSARSAPWIAAR